MSVINSMRFLLFKDFGSELGVSNAEEQLPIERGAYDEYYRSGRL